MTHAPREADLVDACNIPAQRPWSHVIKNGHTARIIDVHGRQAVDALIYCAATRRSATRPGHRARQRLALRRLRDAADLQPRRASPPTPAGATTPRRGAARAKATPCAYGEAARYQHACRENFLVELSKHGLTKRDVVANLNFLMNVPIDPSGDFMIVDGLSRGGNFVDVTAALDILLVISNCPQMNNPGNGFDPTPVRVEIRGPGAL